MTLTFHTKIQHIAGEDFPIIPGGGEIGGRKWGATARNIAEGSIATEKEAIEVAGLGTVGPDGAFTSVTYEIAYGADIA